MYPVRPDWSVSFVPSRLMDKPPLQVFIVVLLPLEDGDGAVEVLEDAEGADVAGNVAELGEVAAIGWPSVFSDTAGATLFCAGIVGATGWPSLLSVTGMIVVVAGAWTCPSVI